MAVPARVPDVPLGVHHRTVRNATDLHTGPDLALAQAAVSLDCIAIDDAVQAVCAEQAIPLRAPEQGVGDAQIAEQLRDLAIRVDAEQAARTPGDGKIAPIGVEVVLHGAQPE